LFARARGIFFEKKGDRLLFLLVEKVACPLFLYYGTNPFNKGIFLKRGDSGILYKEER